MTEKNFPKGFNVKTVETAYGEIIKIGINENDIKNNKFINGWLNIDLKKGKESGKWYGEINEYKSDK